MKLGTAVGVTVLLLMIARGGYLLVYDFSHPEIWDQQPLHDPRIYLPFTAVAFTLVGLWWLFSERKHRRHMRHMLRMQQLTEDYAALTNLQGDEYVQRLQQLEKEYESL